jgi:hypothetical protein
MPPQRFACRILQRLHHLRFKNGTGFKLDLRRVSPIECRRWQNPTPLGLRRIAWLCPRGLAPLRIAVKNGVFFATALPLTLLGAIEQTYRFITLSGPHHDEVLKLAITSRELFHRTNRPRAAARHMCPELTASSVLHLVPLPAKVPRGWPIDCIICSKRAIGFLPECCGGKQGGIRFGTRAVISRYELWPLVSI